MEMHKLGRALLAVVGIALACTACQNLPQRDMGQLRIALTLPRTAAATPATFGPGGALAPGATPPSFTTCFGSSYSTLGGNLSIRGTVTGPGMSTVVGLGVGTTTLDSTGTITTTGTLAVAVPAGSDRSLTVDTLDSTTGAVRCTGQVTGIVITAGATTDVGTVTVSAVGSTGSSSAIETLSQAITVKAGSVTLTRTTGSAPAASGTPLSTISLPSTGTASNDGSTLLSLGLNHSATTLYCYLAGASSYFSGNISTDSSAFGTGSSLAITITYPSTISLTSFTFSCQVQDSGGVTSAASTVLTVITVGTGTLQFSLTWNVAGDMDLHVYTPNGYEIYFGNLSSPDGGTQDRDDTTGTGPENIYWSGTPPNGKYLVCAVDYSESGTVSFTVNVSHNGTNVRTFTGTRSTATARGGGACTSTTSSDYVGTVTVSGSSVSDVGGPPLQPAQAAPPETAPGQVTVYLASAAPSGPVAVLVNGQGAGTLTQPIADVADYPRGCGGNGPDRVTVAVPPGTVQIGLQDTAGADVQGPVSPSVLPGGCLLWPVGYAK